ncbi:MAG TPA: YncE family protein [Nitrososphaerales archaeon]|nr:YncE family protein [Nitrososphaerales archaeon]
MALASLSISLYLWTTRAQAPATTMRTGPPATGSTVQSTGVATSGTPGSLLETFSIGCCVNGPAYDPVNGYIYVPVDNGSVLRVVDGRSDSVVDTVGTDAGPSHVLYDPDNGYLYVSAARTVSVVDPVTGQLLKSIPVGSPETGYPGVLGYNPSNKVLYVATAATVEAINATTGRDVSSLYVANITGTPSGFAYDPVTQDMYVCGGAEVLVISGVTNELTARISVPRGVYAVTYDAADGQLYAVGQQILYDVDGASNRVVSNLTVGGGPSAIGFDPGDGDLYIANTTGFGVTILQAKTGGEVANMTGLGGYRGDWGVAAPSSFVYDSLNQEMYLVNSDGSVWIFD